MKISLPYERKARIEMLPLIDIVFLLLVFFIYAMLSMAVHRGLPVTLPSSETSEIEKHLVLSVTIKSDGAVYLDQERVPLDSLSSTLKNRTEDAHSPGVLVFADKSVSYQKVFNVLDQVRMAGINRISLQAKKEEHR